MTVLDVIGIVRRGYNERGAWVSREDLAFCSNGDDIEIAPDENSLIIIASIQLVT